MNDFLLFSLTKSNSVSPLPSTASDCDSLANKASHRLSLSYWEAIWRGVDPSLVAFEGFALCIRSNSCISLKFDWTGKYDSIWQSLLLISIGTFLVNISSKLSGDQMLQYSVIWYSYSYLYLLHLNRSKWEFHIEYIPIKFKQGEQRRFIIFRFFIHIDTICHWKFTCSLWLYTKALYMRVLQPLYFVWTSILLWTTDISHLSNHEFHIIEIYPFAEADYLVVIGFWSRRNYPSKKNQRET